MMWTFLGLCLIFVTISGHKEALITGFYGQSVLMPCHCSDRSLENKVTWQRESQSSIFKILSHKKNSSTFDDRYKDRAKIFLNEDGNNCSLHLSNLTLNDQGNYRCSFFDPQYSYVNITLKVSASYTVCLLPNPKTVPKGGGSKVFQCRVMGSFPGAQIDWKLDGQPPRNATTTTQNHPSPSAGQYHVSSNLTLELDDTSNLECVVKNPKILLNTRQSCDGETAEHSDENPGSDSTLLVTLLGFLFFIIIAVVIMVVVRCYCKRRKEDVKQRNSDTINYELGELKTYQD